MPLEKTSLQRRFVQTFSAVIVEKQTPDGWVIQSSTGSESSLDQQINDWVLKEDILLLEVKPLLHVEVDDDRVIAHAPRRVRTLLYVVTYHRLTEAGPSEQKAIAPAIVRDGCKAPSIKVIRKDAAGQRYDYIMAGAFGVPEGEKLHPMDAEPAPVPLLSPDFDIRSFGDIFSREEVAQK